MVKEYSFVYRFAGTLVDTLPNSRIRFKQFWELRNVVIMEFLHCRALLTPLKAFLFLSWKGTLCRDHTITRGMQIVRAINEYGNLPVSSTSKMSDNKVQIFTIFGVRMGPFGTVFKLRCICQDISLGIHELIFHDIIMEYFRQLVN